MTATDAPAEHTPDEFALSETLFDPSAEDLVVEVRLATSAIPGFAEYLSDDSKLVPDGPGFVRTSIRVAHFHSLKRLVGTMAGLLTVIGPAEARAAVADWAAAGVERYRNTGAEHS